MNNGRRDYLIGLPSDLKSLQIIQDGLLNTPGVQVKRDDVINNSLSGFPVTRESDENCVEGPMKSMYGVLPMPGIYCSLDIRVAQTIRGVQHECMNSSTVYALNTHAFHLQACSPRKGVT